MEAFDLTSTHRPLPMKRSFDFQASVKLLPPPSSLLFSSFFQISLLLSKLLQILLLQIAVPSLLPSSLLHISMSSLWLSSLLQILFLQLSVYLQVCCSWSIVQQPQGLMDFLTSSLCKKIMIMSLKHCALLHSGVVVLGIWCTWIFCFIAIFWCCILFIVLTVNTLELHSIVALLFWCLL